MVVTPLPIVTEVRPEHLSNTDSPMLVTLFGIVTEVRPEQPQNAQSPMLVKLSEIVTEVRPVQLEYLQLIVFQFVLLKTVEKWFCGFY